MFKGFKPFKTEKLCSFTLNIKSKTPKLQLPVTAIPVIKTFLFSKK